MSNMPVRVGFTPTPSIELKVLAIAHVERLPRLFPVPMHQFPVLLFRWMVRLFTIDADPLAEALREHSMHGIGEVEGIASQVEEADHSLDRPIRVQCAQDQVAGQRGLDGDIGRFLVPHLTDHDDIRVGS